MALKPKRHASKPQAMITNLPLIRSVAYDGVEIYPLVVKQVHKVWAGHVGSVEYQDLIGEALLAVSQARARFSPGRVKFSTFAFLRIKGAAQDLLRKELTYANRYEPSSHLKLIETAGTCSAFETLMHDRILFNQVIQVLETRLDELQAVVLVRTYLEDAKDCEIAEELQLRPSQVPTLREKGLEEIRRHLRIATKDR